MSDNEPYIPPMPFQKEDVQRMEDWGGRALNASEMGLGKTLEGLWLLKRNPNYFPVVVICPSGVKYNWRNNAIRKQFGFTPVILQGVKNQNKPKTPPNFVILNYDIVRAWLPWLQELGPRCVILDECQAVSNPDTGWTKAIRKLCRGVPHIIGMSGTPMTNKPINLFSVLNIIQPKLWGNRASFGMRYCHPKKEYGRWVYDGASNIPELHRKLLETCMIRRLKKDVLGQLPKKIREVISLDIRNPEDYREASRDYIAWLAKRDPAAAARAEKMEMTSRIGFLKRLAAKLKAQVCCDWIENFLEQNPDEKLVTFAIHHKFLDAIERRFGACSVRVDGGLNAKAKQAAVERFQADASCRLFNAQIVAAGTGVDGLQRVCSTAAILELDYRPNIQLQAEARLERIGQDFTTFVYYLVAAATIEEKIALMNESKQHIINEAIDGRYSGAQELDIHTQLSKFIVDTERGLGV